MEDCGSRRSMMTDPRDAPSDLMNIVRRSSRRKKFNRSTEGNLRRNCRKPSFSPEPLRAARCEYPSGPLWPQTRDFPVRGEGRRFRVWLEPVT